METARAQAQAALRRCKTYGWAQTLLNPVAKLMLGSRLHGFMSRRFMLITFTGRRSGRRFTTPISYVRDGDVLLLGIGGPWWKNLRNGARVQARVRGRNHTGVTQVVRDETGMSQAYRVILARNSTQARIMGIHPDANGRPNANDLRRAIQCGAAVVRVMLTD